MYKGIAVSEGIVISKVFKLEHPKVEVIKQENVDGPSELVRYQQAIVKACADIEMIKSKAVGKLSEEELAIFDAHLMVANDPDFIAQVEAMVSERAVNVEYALDEVAKSFISIFESMDDEYMRERAADIKDVSYRLLCHLLGVAATDLTLINHECVIVAHDLTPSDTAQLDRQFTKGFATEIGGRTSHSAIMARSMEIPAVVGCGTLLADCKTDDVIVLDAIAGEIIFNPTAEEIAEYQRKAEVFASEKESLKVLKDQVSRTKDGRQVELVGNIGNPQDAIGVLDNGGEGVGLYRTEFLYMDASALPTEEEQFIAYKTVLESMAGKPVVVRTLDIGGDKELPYLPFPKEMNPFLGYRAIRLCLDRTDIFRTQLRALIRAASFGRLCIMFPMIATLDEFRDAKALYNQEKANLSAAGYEIADNIEVGMMVEIPAAAVLADQFALEADFFSIGTNDLIQYSMAADRMSEKVAYLYQPYNPAILRLIKMTIDGAHHEGKWCGMCGEMAGEPWALPLLLGLGLDEFSMSASAILKARKIIGELDFTAAQALAEKALKCGNSAEVIALVEKESGIKF